MKLIYRFADWLILIGFFASFPCLAQVQLGGDLNPPRGILPSGAYRAEDIETINPVTGALSLHLPITSLPRNIGGGEVFSLDLFYNSPFYNVSTDFNNIDTSGNPTLTHRLSSAQNTGWRYSFAYSLEWEKRQVISPPTCQNTTDRIAAAQWNYANRLTLVLPDGSRHLLRMRDYADTPVHFNGGDSSGNGGDGYYPLDPDGKINAGNAPGNAGWVCPGLVPQPAEVTSGNVNYYTTDGTYLAVIITPNSGFYSTNHNVDSLAWSLSFPDGTVYTQSGFAPGAGTLNGASLNCTPQPGNPPCYGPSGRFNRHSKGWFTQNLLLNGNFRMDVQDDAGRYIHVTHTGDFQDVIETQGSGSVLTWQVNWGSTGGAAREYYCTQDQFQNCTLYVGDMAVRSIVLPQQLCDPNAPNCTLQYTFGYNTDNGTGIGEVSHIQFPLGSAVSYSYSLDHSTGTPDDPCSASTICDWSRYLRDPVISKTTGVNLDYFPSVSDPCVDVGLYNYCEKTTYNIPFQGPVFNTFTQSFIIAPDGGRTDYFFYPATPFSASPPCPSNSVGPSCVDPRSGLVWKIQQPDKTIVRFWNTNVPFGAPLEGGNFNNPYINAEYVIAAGGQTRARAFSYDQNGNVTSLTEYDFGVFINPGNPPNGLPAGSVLRTTQTAYFNPTLPAVSQSPQLSGNSYAYLIPGSTRVINAPLAIEVDPGSISSIDPALTSPMRSRTEYVYYPLGVYGSTLDIEPFFVRHWDSGRAPGLACSSISVPCLDGSTNAQVETYAYDPYGSIIQETDPIGNRTYYVYDPNAQIPGYAPAPGMLLTEIDRATGTGQQQTTRFSRDIWTGLPNSVTDPNGVVTSFTRDGIGRPTLIREASGIFPYERQTSTRYATQSRFVTTRSDLNTTGDGALITVQHFDQLGRVWRTRQIETGGVPQDSDNFSGIKVDTQRQRNSNGRYDLVSNPYKQTNDPTMGWTMTNFDQAGRPVEAWSTAGAATPIRNGPGSAPLGGVTNTGRVITTYDQSDPLMSNQLVTQTTDQSQRITKRGVDGLGRIASVTVYPNGQASKTTYHYDAADNVTSVVQPDPGGVSRLFSYDSLGRLHFAQSPEAGPSGGKKQYFYDGAGNLTSTTDERGVTTTLQYDPMKRLIRKSYSDSTPVVTYAYDSSSVSYSRGRLTSVSGGISTTSYNAYDPLGRVTSSTQTTNNQPYAFPSYSYNLAGGLKSVQYPSGRVVSTSFDSVNRPISVSAPTTYASGIVYSAHGAIQQMSLAGANLLELTGYNSRLEAESVVRSRSGTELLRLQYSYGSPLSAPNIGSNDGNPQSQTINGSQVNGTFTQTYTYDALNRLAAANEAGWGQTYVYDERGNRALLGGSSIADGTGSGTYTPQTPNTTSVPYDQYNRWAPAVNSYDVNGTQTHVGARGFSYDAEGRVATASDSGTTVGTYSYDGAGRRVQRVANGATTVYVYDALGQLAAEYSTASQTAGTRHVMTDPLGSVRLVTDGAGTPVSTHDYLPFGEEIPANWTVRGAVYGAADGVSQRFTGMERDVEAGLDHFGARYFSGAQGRFTSPDEPLADQWAQDPRSWNLYNYVRNNPLKYTDPTGRACDFSGTPMQMLSNCVIDPLIGVAKEVANQTIVPAANLVNDVIDPAISFTGFQFGQAESFTPSNSDQRSGMEFVQFTEPYAASGQAAVGIPKEGAERPVDVIIDSNRSPQAAAHIQEAQAAGHPSVVTLERTRARPNRAASMEGQARAPRGFDRDEYPPACCREGGAGASVRPIPRADNRNAGGQLGNQVRLLPDGTIIRIRVK